MSVVSESASRPRIPSHYLIVAEAISETRHHQVPAHRLRGGETMTDVIALALAMVKLAYTHDAACRFRFNGSLIFARGERP